MLNNRQLLFVSITELLLADFFTELYSILLISFDTFSFLLRNFAYGILVYGISAYFFSVLM